ncbi:MAG TPA: response regulator transcription factor [Chloroflexi bacterium]|nr:response regulator transcription factor [Chloroflexota bacterium]
MTQNPEPRPRILIADDHGIVRTGLSTLLASAGFEVVAAVPDGLQAVEQACALRPDLALLDIRMPEVDGLQALRHIKECSPETIVIMLTTYASLEYLSRAVMLGAAGYLTKDLEPERLPDLLRTVLAGEHLLDPEMLNRVLTVAAAQMDTSGDEMVEALTEQETRVLALIARGMNNRQIAETLFISQNTVKTHVRHIFDKLHVADRTQAAIWAVRRGL